MVASTLDKLRILVGLDERPEQYGLLLSGGGARASYQAGVLRYIADHFPGADFENLTGVSAGAINAAFLSNTAGSLSDSASQLVKNWEDIRAEHVFASESSFGFFRGLVFRRSAGIDEDGSGPAMLDTEPLRQFLRDCLNPEDDVITGITRKLHSGRLRAVAIVTTNYATGQTVTWVQGRNISRWERPTRVGINTTLTVDHIMASTSIPILFPAVRIGDAYYGDGGIRLSAPLAPLVHLGSTRILAISTRYQRSRAEADDPAFVGYPPLSQIFGLLMNAIFLDALDQDALTMDRINALLEQLPARKRLGLRPIDLLVLRPSVDLGKMAGEYESKVTGVLGLISRSMGAARSKSPDWLSMLLFEPDYVSRLIEIGYQDAHDQRDQLDRFFGAEDMEGMRREAGLTGTG